MNRFLKSRANTLISLGNYFLLYIPSADRFFEKYVVIDSTELNSTADGGTSYVEPCVVRGNKKLFVIKRTYCNHIEHTNYFEHVGGNLLRKEAAVLHAISLLPHSFEKQFIVKYIHSGVNDDGTPFLILERFTGKTLDQAIEETQGFGSENVVKFGCQLLYAARLIGRAWNFPSRFKK